MNRSIDREFLVRTLQDLVRINSINPELVPGAPGEEAIARYLDQKLRELGIGSQLKTIRPARSNVVGVIAGKGGGRSLMLNAHTDTVGVEGMEDPFSGLEKDGRIYGRGAQDMKASIAAILAVGKALVDRQLALKGNLLLAFVVDEEHGSLGTKAVLKDHCPDAAIVTEPTELGICTAHKGFGVFEIRVTGKAAHGGRFQDGVDANIAIGPLLTALQRLSASLLNKEKHPLLGPASMHVPLIRGGSELFIYAAGCSVTVEFRTLPGQTPDYFLRILNRLVQDAVPAELRPQVELQLWRNPFEVEKTASIVRAADRSLNKVLGKAPHYLAHQWWEDSALFAEAGIETVVLGPLGEGLHTSEEWVDIDSVVLLAEALLETALDFCNTGPGD